MRLSNHIYLLSGFAYGLHPNVYGIRSDNGLVLIDTGLGDEDYACIQATLGQWGLAGLPIQAALITHAHFDHAGNAYRFRESGARIVAGDIDAQGIEAGDERTIDYTYSLAFPACQVDQIVHDGDALLIDGLHIQVIHVPGHSRGSMAYDLRIDGREALFTGDFIRAGENGQSAKLGFSGAEDFDPQAYMASLRRIRRWRPDMVLCGHHQPCLRDGYKLLDKAYTYALVHWRQPSVAD